MVCLTKPIKTFVKFSAQNTTFGSWKNRSIPLSVDGDLSPCGYGYVAQSRSCQDGLEVKCREHGEELTNRKFNHTFQDCLPGISNLAPSLHLL